jgi:23S rRNA (adenine2503-C2)-methyltransferase
MTSAPEAPEFRPTSLLEIAAGEWGEALAAVAGDRYRGDQVANWVFKHGVFDFAAMGNLPRELRERLAACFSVEPPPIEARFESADGTRRFLLGLADGRQVEAVYMPYPDRVTLCISSQVGCRFACGFCQTGVMGLQRSLSAGEILGQVLRLRQEEQRLDRPVNVVFMGQGEPLDAPDSVVAAVRALQDPGGPGLSRQRITVSTVGVVGALPRIAAMGEARPRLAVSLNATTDAVRSRLMPINRKWPIATLLGALEAIPWRNRERVTFEYVLLAGVNDSLDDARRLGGLLARLPAKVNLIPWNPLPSLPFRRPDPEQIERFRITALATGLDVLVRYSRGADIAAACGQLHASTQPV